VPVVTEESGTLQHVSQYYITLVKLCYIKLVTYLSTG